jgi:2-polyprenyl-6-hydroxyphenyl methylase/3-demethylubiquinone-9 3-methyltransferase
VYELASPRVRQYLDAEIEHVRSRLKPRDVVLELGCGYGRVTAALAESARQVVGIDTAEESLELGRTLFADLDNVEFLSMDASAMSFPDSHFDVVVCVQNGICAFGVPAERLVAEALRVTREGGLVLFSTYSSKFWPERLSWFEAQAAAGLLGPIDRGATGNGVIVCEDGFRAGAMSVAELRELCASQNLDCEIAEVDGASLFCEITRPCAL